MITDEPLLFEGGCTCRSVRYRMTTKPMFVHCCHCRWCQRETGSAFALNAMIEADRVELLQGEVEVVNTPSNSGKGQKIARCPSCRVAVWSNYAGAGDAVRFVRVGTLDEPDRLPPDIHIFTSSKQPWVVLAPTTPAVAEYYKARDYWPPESLERRAALLAAKPRQQSHGAQPSNAIIPSLIEVTVATIKYADLRDAFDFVSFGDPFESSAFICTDTGVIYCTSDTLELDEEVPEDLETSDRYLAVPHKNDLNLGRDLVLSFVDQALPDDYGTVAGFFRRKGAYSRFKQLLESRGVLDVWYTFEADAVEAALRQWCEDNRIQLSPVQPEA